MGIKAANHAFNRTAIYGASTILRSSASLILLPIYTRYLSPADYGTIELITLIVDIVAILIGARITDGVFRFFNMADSDTERREVVGSALTLVVLANCLGAALIILFDDSISSILFGEKSYSHLIFLFSFSILFTALIELCMSFLRAQDLAKTFLAFSVLRLATQISLNLFFIVHLRLGVIGIIYASLLSGAIVAALLTGYTLLRFGFVVRTSVIRKFISFSIPLVLSSLGMFFITYGDRYFLRYYHGLDEVGIYSLGYKFGFIFFSLCWAPFSMYWGVKQFEIAKKNPDSPVFAKVFKISAFLLIGAAFSLAVLSREAMMLISDESFWPAADIAPVVILAYLFLGWTDFTRFGLLYKDQTKYLAIGTLVGVIIIAVGYFTLIPAYGGQGAAWATLVGLFARFVYIYRTSQSFYNMKIEWKPVVALLVIAVSLYLPLTIIKGSLLITLPLKTAIIIVAGIAIFLSPLVTRLEREVITATIAVKFAR